MLEKHKPEWVVFHENRTVGRKQSHTARCVRKNRKPPLAEDLLPLPGPGVSPASVSKYPKGYSETLLAHAGHAGSSFISCVCIYRSTMKILKLLFYD